MAKIEIDINVYNSLNSRIKELENEVIEKDNKLKKVNETNNDLKDTISYIVNETTFLDRLIRWNYIKDIVNTELKKDGYTKDD